jgi:cytochrome c biogenesis protein CcmG, thiol:disulfide interchange protein DsbE
MRLRFLLPLIGFIVLVGFLLVGLNLNPRQVPSPLVGKPAPEFQLEQLHESNKTLTSKDNLGKVWMPGRTSVAGRIGQVRHRPGLRSQL